MGIYDREYYRQDGGPGGFSGPRTMVGVLILLNVLVYFADAVFTADSHAMTYLLSAKVGTLTNPLFWWQFLTYGFAHSPQPQHIVFNMLGLWFLGRDVEVVLGRREFLRFYLVTLVIGSIAWAVANRIQGGAGGYLMGASGAVAGIVVLYAMHFPHRTLLLFFVIPVPAWFAGLLLVAMDLYGSLRNSGNDGPQIAYTVHLTGAAFAFLYARMRWNLGRLLPDRLSWDRLKPRPRLRLHEPDEPSDAGDGKLSDEVDRILEKISREGEASLTRRERRLLESASREYQRRRRTPDAE